MVRRGTRYLSTLGLKQDRCTFRIPTGCERTSLDHIGRFGRTLCRPPSTRLLVPGSSRFAMSWMRRFARHRCGHSVPFHSIVALQSGGVGAFSGARVSDASEANRDLCAGGTIIHSSSFPNWIRCCGGISNGGLDLQSLFSLFLGGARWLPFHVQNVISRSKRLGTPPG